MWYEMAIPSDHCIRCRHEVGASGDVEALYRRLVDTVEGRHRDGLQIHLQPQNSQDAQSSMDWEDQQVLRRIPTNSAGQMITVGPSTQSSVDGGHLQASGSAPLIFAGQKVRDSSSAQGSIHGQTGPEISSTPWDTAAGSGARNGHRTPNSLDFKGPLKFLREEQGRGSTGVSARDPQGPSLANAAQSDRPEIAHQNWGGDVERVLAEGLNDSLFRQVCCRAFL